MTEEERRRFDADFLDPSAEYRSIPFWAWNAKMDNAEIEAQIHSMKTAGMGGFFMHSRDGLETPYMGEEWISAVRAAVGTASAEGMKAWVYDEDRWPSGASGGKIPALGDEYRAKGLTLEIAAGDYEADDAVIVLFRARVRDLEYLDGTRLDPRVSRAAETDRVFLLFRIEVASPDEWFNGNPPPDNMNPDSVERFIDMNYRPYRDIAGKEFGRTIPGVFTDEPSVHDRHSRYTPGRGWIPWTYGFADFFASRRGYDPMDSIALVFFDGPAQQRIRHDYWRTVTELFSESYTKKIGAWCARNDLFFSGHFLWENQLGTATRTGGAIMPHYRFQHVPGIDMLCEQIEEVITVKQCTSVANQYGRKRVLSETYGCAGWELNFEGQKWLGDWQFALGVNLRSQHLALYSLKGCRKRDYPPVFNYNTTWWNQNKLVEDYFARLSLVLTQGRPVRDLLILHPSSTAWCRLASNPTGFADRGADRNIQDLNAYGDEFNRLLRAILGTHIDFDLGDETILSETGRVEGTSLVVNLASYDAVLIPPIDTMLASTANLLRRFLDSGGRAIAMTPEARLIEGVPSEGLGDLYRHRNTILVDGHAGAVRAVAGTVKRMVSIRNRNAVEDADILCMHRHAGEWSTLFAVNTDRERGRETEIEIEGDWSVEELDLLEGRIIPVDSRSGKGTTRFMTRFGAAGSRLYRLDVTENGAAPGGGETVRFAPSTNYLVNPPIIGALGPSARFRRTAPNALVLDTCRYALHDEPWSVPMDVWRAQRELRDRLGMRQIYGNGLEQRYLWTSTPHPRDGTPARISFSFAVHTVPGGILRLALEDPTLYRIELNGTRVPSRPDGWFLDRAFETIPLPVPERGVNELVLSCNYSNRMEMEDCFLLGDFAVDGERQLVAEPKELRFGDWCLQGYPHYCGSMVYEFDLQNAADRKGRTVLRLGEFSAVDVIVRVNGHRAGNIPWKDAHTVDLTGSLKSGSNRIDIEVVSSPRNLLGPFHLARGTVPFNEWTAFRPEGCEYTQGYILHRYGLFSQIILSEE